MRTATRVSLGPALERWASTHAPEPIVVYGEDGEVLMANAAARAVFGEQLQGFLGPAATEALFAAIMRDGRASTEHATCGRDGGRTFAIRASGVSGAVVVSAREVTRERALAAEIARLRRVEPVGHVAASLAHDLNNVLTVVLAVGQLLERELPHSARATQYAHELTGAAQHGADMVRQVLGLVRGELARADGSGLPEMLADLRGLLERISGSAVKVELEVAPDLGEVSVDRAQLARVLLNLAANARDAMPSGGRLRIQAKNVRFDACPGDATAAAQGYVALLVSDDGVGMADEIRERVLDGYVTTKDTNGTGLGLLGAHQFVTAAGGCLSIRSAPGDGTTIALYLPHVGARDEETLSDGKVAKVG